MSRSWCLPLWCVLVLCLRDVLAQPEDGCYSPGSIAGIVIATVVVTLVAAALAAAFAWYLWKQRKNGFGGEDKGAEKGPPMDKQLIVKENSDYAFDNPYFKDDETDHTKHDAAEKGESGYRLDNGNVTPSQNNTKANGQAKKNRPFSSLPFHAVFHPSGKKQQQQKATMDDTYISKAAERVEVPLRGHDFTGLGFDICGNMRDGIFVKDVLHRGPASESGKIKAGDRIVGVRVSFRAMVYEDALTILSYASPYDVRLELEKERVQSPPCPPATTGRRLLHPLYRSRSIDDLTQIDKHLGTDSPAIPSKSPKEATPKRSQSVEASNGGLKSRVAAFTLIKSKDDTKSRKSSTSSCDSASTKPSTTPLPEIAAEVKEEPVCVKKEIKSSRFRVEQINVKSEAPSKVSPPVKPARDLPEEKIPVKEEEKPQVVDAQPAAVEVDLPPPAEIIAPEDPPTAPPRKTGTPAKRRAPAPPPTETAALVHRAQEQPQLTEEAPPEDVPPPPPTSAVPSGDAVSLSGGEEAAPSSPGKRKAASLGDLTRLDTEAAAAASTVLERAVSLDLQQSLPGENLGKQQKRILRAPAFQDDYMESKESDLDVQIIQENGLKRWENGLDSVLLPPLSNGHTEDDDEVATTSGMTIVTMTNDKTTITTPKDESGKDDEVTIVHPTVTPPLKKKILTIDLDLDTSSSSSSSSSSLPQLTSTPAQRKLETPPPEESSSTRVGPPLFAPVSVSIPVIKPDMTHFEKLPSPPGGRGVQLQSLYRPLFGEEQQPPLVANGGSSPPNSVAGFAKTLIVPGPNEVDSLLGLATEPDDQTLATEAKATLDVE